MSNAQEINAVFFGCWGAAGHYMYLPGGGHPSEIDLTSYGFPHDHDLDGSHVFLPLPECRGEGRITFLAAPSIYVMSWWGSPWDTRGRVNNHFMYRSFSDMAAYNLWHAFGHYFPELRDAHSAHRKPIFGRTYV